MAMWGQRHKCWSKRRLESCSVNQEILKIVRESPKAMKKQGRISYKLQREALLTLWFQTLASKSGHCGDLFHKSYETAHGVINLYIYYRIYHTILSCILLDAILKVVIFYIYFIILNTLPFPYPSILIPQYQRFPHFIKVSVGISSKEAFPHYPI